MVIYSFTAFGAYILFIGGYMYRILQAVLLVIALGIFIQGNAFAKDDDVVAKIGNKKITVTEFNKLISYFDAERQKMIESNPQMKETILTQLVQSMVVSDIAKKKGFDKKPEIKQQLEFFSDSFVATEYLKREVTHKVSVSDNEVKQYYDAHQDEFRTPEMVKAKHILIRVAPGTSEEDKKKALGKAEDILKQVKGGKEFEKLAAEVSEDPGSKTKGGDLGFFPKGRMVKPFEDAAFALKPGELSKPVETQFGYHIIKVDEIKEPSLETFDKVKEKINQKLVQEKTRTKVTEFIEKSMKEAGAEVHPELLTGEKK
jgi:peptidyl-prolyl cis-trans isomerase C